MKLENNHSYLNQMNAGDLIKSNGEHGALELVSQQFEALFLQNVLKQMRSASDVMADKDSPLSSQNDGLYRDWHDAELAGRLSQMQSTGLAEVMTRQLSAGLQPAPEAVASNTRLDMSTTGVNQEIRHHLGSHSSEHLSTETAATASNEASTTAMQPALILPLMARSQK